MYPVWLIELLLIINSGSLLYDAAILSCDTKLLVLTVIINVKVPRHTFFFCKRIFFVKSCPMHMAKRLMEFKICGSGSHTL